MCEMNVVSCFGVFWEFRLDGRSNVLNTDVQLNVEKGM